MTERTGSATSAEGSTPGDRRTDVLRSALLTFARFGYRKASMQQLAEDAQISRPGLYFLFPSKQDLFRDAVDLSVREDLAAAQAVLSNPNEPLNNRLSAAFDHWSGRYIGPLTRDISAMVDSNKHLLGPYAQAAPARFAQLIEEALSSVCDANTSERVTQTLISTSIGIKHQVDEQALYREKMSTAIKLLVPGVT